MMEKPRLNGLVIFYLAGMFGAMSAYFALTGVERMNWHLGPLSFGLYTTTGVIYALVALSTCRRLGWYVVPLVGVVGLSQELTWNFGYFFLVSAQTLIAQMNLKWLVYELTFNGLIGGSSVLIMRRASWRFRRLPTFAYAACLLYYLIGLHGPATIFGTATTPWDVFWERLVVAMNALMVASSVGGIPRKEAER